MSQERRISRRSFLKFSVIAAIGAAVQACAQPAQPTSAPAQPTTAPAQPTKAPAQPTATPVPATATPVPKPKFNEAPMLAELVKAGKLPPVEERLPKEPLVVPVVEEIGQYGGTWRRAHIGPADIPNSNVRLYRESLLHFSVDGSSYEPNVFTKWEISDGGKTYTCSMREGIKWSDGVPATADDLYFAYEDIALNKELTPNVPGWLKFGGEPGVMEKLDDFTVRFKFIKPYALFPLILAGGILITPKHYLKQFHAKYVDKAKLDADTKAAGFETWNQLFGAKNNSSDNPDLPTWHTWVTKSRNADQRHTMERNPYYWKVDPQGNQLPYIDYIVHDLVGGADIVLAKCIAGEIDMQGRHLGFKDIPLLKENEQKGDYRVLLWKSTTGVSSMVMFNMSFDADPVKAKYLRDKKFHQAVSHAIDRDDFNRVRYLGRAKPRQATVIDESADFKPEFATRYIQYDVAKANQMLDELGLTKRDAEGYRIAPENNETLTLINYVVAAYAPDAQLITEYMKKVGLKVVVKEEERTIHYNRMTANEIELSMWGMDGAIYPSWLNYAYWIVPWVRGSVRIGPAIGQWRETGGKEGMAPYGDVKKALDLFDEALVETDQARQIELASQVLDIASENVWTCGIVQAMDAPWVVKNNFRNVPATAINDTTFLTEKNTHPEQYFIKKS